MDGRNLMPEIVFLDYLTEQRLKREALTDSLKTFQGFSLSEPRPSIVELYMHVYNEPACIKTI